MNGTDRGGPGGGRPLAAALLVLIALLTVTVLGATSAAATQASGGYWSRTGPLTAARGFHTAERQAIRLSNGDLLVEGGDVTNGKFSTATSNAELFDPSTKTWTATGPLGTARDF